jgi:hypothetical protein
MLRPTSLGPVIRLVAGETTQFKPSEAPENTLKNKNYAYFFNFTVFKVAI